MHFTVLYLFKFVPLLYFQGSFMGSQTVDNKDFESVVLMKMRQAEERKRLIEQMMKEDELG